MNNKSKIWTSTTDIEFCDIVSKSNSYNEIHNKLGLSIKPNNEIVKSRMHKLGLNNKHFNRRLCISDTNKKIPLHLMLTENSKHARNNLKRRLLNAGMLANKCSICGQLPIWNGIPLVLHIDHINGIHNDNRIENLRMVCPNCHSQTSTFSGKNLSTGSVSICSCGNIKTKQGASCLNCRDNRRRKTIRPDADTLVSEVKEHGYYKLRSKYGVSDNAIRKWVKAYGFNPKTFEPL